MFLRKDFNLLRVSDHELDQHELQIIQFEHTKEKTNS